MIKPNMLEAKIRSDKIVNTYNYQLNKNYLNMFKGLKYYIKTYGCQMNERDSESIKAILEEMGFTYIDNYKEADLVILNTCSIRENAHNKAFGMLGRLKNLKLEKKDLIVGLCGCMPQEETVAAKIIDKFKWVNFVLGTHNINNLPELLVKSIDERQIEVYSIEGDIIEDMPAKRDNPYKAFVNIIYGCDKFCTYCIVPYVRGKQRSRTKEAILKEINELIKQGYQEITLLGQNVNAYGKDFKDKYLLEDLLEDIAKTSIKRIRFVTSHPWDFTDNLIEVMKKYPNICNSIHLPVQSGSNKILKLMGRKYTKEEYLILFNKLKKAIPNIAISTDIIVGFPNETKEDYNETIDLVNKCKFDMVFSFIYSKRDNTPASLMKDDTLMSVKEERLYNLNKIVNNYFLENNNKLLNNVFPVLIEGKSLKKQGYLFGYSDTNKLVNVKGKEDLIGQIVNVKITKPMTWSLDGEIDESTSAARN